MKILVYLNYKLEKERLFVFWIFRMNLMRMIFLLGLMWRFNGYLIYVIILFWSFLVFLYYLYIIGGMGVFRMG